jgi:hypothetical protein
MKVFKNQAVVFVILRKIAIFGINSFIRMTGKKFLRPVVTTTLPSPLIRKKFLKRLKSGD